MRVVVITVGALLLIYGSLAQTPERPNAVEQPQHRRLALLIANSSYSHLPPIPAAMSELDIIKSAVVEAGFATDTIANASVQDFLKGDQEFVARVHPGDVCLLYFSGYAIHA